MFCWPAVPVRLCRMSLKMWLKSQLYGINEMIANYYIHTVPLKKDVAEFLRQLEIRKVKMCVATASNRYLVEAALKRCGIRNYFSELFTCESVGTEKEHPISIVKHRSICIQKKRKPSFLRMPIMRSKQQRMTASFVQRFLMPANHARIRSGKKPIYILKISLTLKDFGIG